MYRPLVLTDPEPAAPKNTGAQPLPNIVRGSELFAELTGGYGGTGLPGPTEQTALTIAAVYACVNLIAGAIASLPLNVYDRDETGFLTVRPNDDLWWVLNEQMTPRWSATAGWEFIILSLLLHGDGFARIIRDPRTAQPIGLDPIHPNRVYVLVSNDGMRLIYVVAPDPLIPLPASGQQLVLDQDDMLHVPGFGFDGRRGLSPLRYALRNVGGVSLAAQDYAGRFFANGARPDYALQTDAQLAPEKVAEIYDRLDTRHRGTQQSHRPLVLTGGLKVETLSMPAEEMQLLETRQFQIEEVARIYGVPPFMIGHNEKTTSWGSGVEAMGKAFVRYALAQHLTKIATEANRKLSRTARKVYAHDTAELERADTAALFTALRTAVGGAGSPGFMSADEARRVLRLKAKGGDADKLFNGGGHAPDQAAQPPGP